MLERGGDIILGRKIDGIFLGLVEWPRVGRAQEFFHHSFRIIGAKDARFGKGIDIDIFIPRRTCTFRLAGELEDESGRDYYCE